MLDGFFKWMEPDLIIGTGNYDTYREIYEVVNHELSHASHFNKVGSNYWSKYVSHIIDKNGYGNDGSGTNAGICEVGEMWGNAMGYIQGCEAYNDTDGLNQSYSGNSFWSSWIHPDPIWALITREILTKRQVFDSMTSDVDTVEKWISKLVSMYPSKEDAIRAAFAHNDVPIVIGTKSPTINTNVEYAIPPIENMSRDFTFTGWTISTPTPTPTYTTPDGLSNRDLTIRFTGYGKHEIIANFTLPDDTEFRIEKTVELAPPANYQNAPVISADKTSVTQGERVVFSLQGAPSPFGVTYEWMINGAISSTITNSIVLSADQRGLTVQCRIRYTDTHASQWSNTVVVSFGGGQSSLPTPWINAIETSAPSGQKIYDIYAGLDVPPHETTGYIWEWEILDGVEGYNYGTKLASWSYPYYNSPRVTFDTFFGGNPRMFIVRCRVRNPPSTVSAWGEVYVDGVTGVIYAPSSVSTMTNMSKMSTTASDAPEREALRFEFDGGLIIVE